MVWFKKKQNKYNATKYDYNGIIYHSKKEAAFAKELDLRIKAKDIKSWTRQEKISIDVNGHHICNYYIDFTITHNDNSIEFTEIKGYETDVWKLKWKLFEALYGDRADTTLTVIK